MVSVLTPAEVLIAARRLAGGRPHLVAVAGIVHQEDLWKLCRDELTGVDVRVDGWDIRGRWFGVVVGATPDRGVATRRDDPLARDRRPDRTARTATARADRRNSASPAGARILLIGQPLTRPGDLRYIDRTAVDARIPAGSYQPRSLSRLSSMPKWWAISWMTVRRTWLTTSCSVRQIAQIACR